jgi:hypothetical protein
LALLDRTSREDRWPDLERAAEERYFDALTLASGSELRSTGAVYLAGYVAEILLKTAYYHVRGVGQTDDVVPELRGMAARAAELGYHWPSGRTRHDLQAIAGLLIEERRARGRPLNPYLAIKLGNHVVVIIGHWSEQLRYKDAIATEAELVELFESVSWIYDNYGVLGS